MRVTNIASRFPDLMVAWKGDERFHYTLDGQNTVLALTAEGSEVEPPDAVYEYSPYGEQSSESMEDSRAGELNAFGYTGAYQFLDGTVHQSHRSHDCMRTVSWIRAVLVGSVGVHADPPGVVAGPGRPSPTEYRLTVEARGERWV